MKSLQFFTSQALTTNETSNVKGGYFCEIYIGYCDREGKKAKGKDMKKAMKLDEKMAKHGLDKALKSKDGKKFMSKYI